MDLKDPVTLSLIWTIMVPIMLRMTYLDEVKRADWANKHRVPAISKSTALGLGGLSAFIYSLCLILYLMD